MKTTGLTTDQQNEVNNITARLGSDPTLKELAMDGIESRWANSFVSNEYDFCEGLAVNFSVDVVESTFNIFDAEGKVTRVEAATMLVKWKGINPETYGDTCEAFADVEDGEWYTKFVNAAYENGLIAGKEEGIFDPDGYLTRGEAAALLVTGSGWLADATDVGFTDAAEAWYTPYINTACVHGVMTGGSWFER